MFYKTMGYEHPYTDLSSGYEPHHVSAGLNRHNILSSRYYEPCLMAEYFLRKSLPTYNSSR